MSKPLAKSAESVQAVLKDLGLDCKVLEFPEGTRTSADAALAVGCDISQIAKTLIFKTKNTHRAVLISASGPNRVCEKTIEAHVGEPIEKADAEFVREVTGFAIGGIPPIGHKNLIDLNFIDHDLMSFEDVWAAAGTPNSVFCIKSQELAKATRSKIIKVTAIK